MKWVSGDVKRNDSQLKKSKIYLQLWNRGKICQSRDFLTNPQTFQRLWNRASFTPRTYFAVLFSPANPKIFHNLICSIPHNYISNTSVRQPEPLLFHTSMGLMSSLCHCAWKLQTTVAIWNDITTACCNHFPQTAVSWGNWTYLILWRLQDCHSFCIMVPNYNMYHCVLVG